MQVQSPPATQSNRLQLINQLSTPDGIPSECSRRAKTQIDLLLLAIEALDLGGAEAMLASAKELDLEEVIRGRVNLWLLRSSNPLRRFSQRQPMSQDEGKALVLITCFLARRLTVLIRQLLLGYQQLEDQGLSLDHHFRLSDYLARFRSHFRARMNAKRSAVIAYSSDEKLNELAIELLTKLLFCTGTNGADRLWMSLFDGEVS
ncbi:MAG: Protein of unknown function (DUF3038) [Phormidesmis priestleyi Ana]|uniref:DUF3038 domain-containing protein n=1 Tax=Phormidesmis priestleyi Ana TaxID=1666911 RepID=A0A0P7YXM5_9CYAN|nr:MAG: Protein of unknown function (DUF3038) [Phormidesmis priestleyi Ana]